MCEVRHCASSCTGGCSAVTLSEEAAQPTTNASGDLCDPAKLAKSQGRLTAAKVFSVGDAGVYIEQRQSASPTGSSCTDGCPILVSGTDEAPAASNAPSCCEDAQQAPGAEPPALLTLSQHKDPSSTLSIPHWQEELLKAFRGRRLSELFEPRTGQTPSGHELGRLLAEFPKSGGSAAQSDDCRHSCSGADFSMRCLCVRARKIARDREGADFQHLSELS